MSIASSPEQSLNRLRSQLNWITRISTALGTCDNVADVYSIVLSGLLAPTGLGYSRALLFENDVAAGVVRGSLALMHTSLASMELMGKELEAEAIFLDQRREKIEQSALLEERLEAEAEYSALTSSTQWVTLFQQLNPDNELTHQLLRMTFATQNTEGPRHTFGSIFDEAPWWRQARLLTKAELGQRLPMSLAVHLPETFAAAPLFTKGGLRALVFVDRNLEAGNPIDRMDIWELDWFTRQAALAIENVELISDTHRTYHELKQLDLMKSNFLSIISHELRTPLTAMTGFVDLILEGRVGEINENQRMLLTRVAKNTAHLNHLVNDLLEVAEIEAEGTVEVKLVPVEPLTVLMDTLPKLENRRREQAVKVIPVITEAIPAIVCDERALARILFHLLDNAMKFSVKNACVEVHFRNDGTRLHIDVKDSGVGIAQENLKHIFRQFYQVDNSLTRGHEGLGLGLAVTNMLVQATRGEISVASEPGVGSTFTVSFALA